MSEENEPPVNLTNELLSDIRTHIAGLEAKINTINEKKSLQLFRKKGSRKGLYALVLLGVAGAIGACIYAMRIEDELTKLRHQMPNRTQQVIINEQPGVYFNINAPEPYLRIDKEQIEEF